jgi:hypothetical protein
MLNPAEIDGAASEPSRSDSPTSLIELSDEEILSWLTTSILDDGEGAEPAADAPTPEFWDRVAVAEARLAELGVTGPAALDQAIGLVGMEVSFAVSTGADFGDALGRDELRALQNELVERAGRAVAMWASLQGSALRAASHGRG